MSFIKQILTLTALIAIVFMPNIAYSQPVVIPGGKEFVYAGIAAVFGYIFYSWHQQRAVQAPVNNVRLITANELFRSINTTFKTYAEDFYENYLVSDLKDQGYRIYLAADQQEMAELLEKMRLFVNQIPKQDAPNILHYDIDNLAQELKNELIANEHYVDSNLRQHTGARAARGVYYVNRFNNIVVNAASQQ